MTLWFEIVGTIGLVFVIFLMVKLIRLQKSNLDYTEAHYNTTKTFTKWIVTSGMFDMVGKAIESFKQIREMKKNGKTN